LDSKFRTKFSIIRADLEEHLSAINENSSEIQSLFDYLQELDHKIEKFSSRLDQLELDKNYCQHNEIKPLNSFERQIFLTLYTEEVPLSFKELSIRIKVPLDLVQEGISQLSKKGVPIIRSHFNNQMFLQLDQNFKERQAKENLINLSLHSFF
jgi:hypothetical protein